MWESMKEHKLNQVILSLPLDSFFFTNNLWWNQLCKLLGWYQSLHFVTLTLVSPQNDIWGTSTEIPYGCMMCHYPYLGGASKWLKEISLTAWPIRNTTQIWYGISLLAPQTSFCGETSGGITKYQLFTQAGKSYRKLLKVFFTDSTH